MKKMHCFYAAGISFVLSVLSIDVRPGEIREKKNGPQKPKRIKKRKIGDIINLFKR